MPNKYKQFGVFSAVALSILVLLLSFNVSFAENTDSTHTEYPEGETESQVNTHEVAPENEKFNAGKLIIEHISDAYDWHIAGHIAIPLPVILYSDKGFDIFMSSAFEHGHAIYKGKQNYALKEGHIKVVNDNGEENEEATSQLWDISITKNVASLFVSLALMLWIFLTVAKAYARNPGKAPKGLQSWVEPMIIFVRDDIAISAIGEKKYKKYLPFLLTAFFFIWINNLMGLIPLAPGGANVTGNIAIAMTLAIIVFVITVFSGNKNYWRHIVAMPGVPVGVLALLTPIEIIGVFLKPFVLMIRLFANILAGHIIALSFFSLIFIFAEMNTGLGFGVSILSIAFTVFMGMLELLVAFLQAYVFTLLAAMYFGSAVEEHHHEEHH